MQRCNDITASAHLWPGRGNDRGIKIPGYSLPTARWTQEQTRARLCARPFLSVLPKRCRDRFNVYSRMLRMPAGVFWSSAVWRGRAVAASDANQTEWTDRESASVRQGISKYDSNGEDTWLPSIINDDLFHTAYWPKGCSQKDSNSTDVPESGTINQCDPWDTWALK